VSITNVATYAAMPVAAYLCGAIPFGVLIARARGVDLRKQGSGNIGATNVARALGRKYGYLCFALDVLKGLLPVLLAGRLVHAMHQGVPTAAVQGAWLAVGVGAVLGHVFSVFVGFRGGKGVATSLGVVLGFYPYLTPAGLAAFVIWIACALIWRYVSLASIVAVTAFPLLFAGSCVLLGWPLGRLWPLLAFAAAMAVLVVVRHRANIGRLLNGTESKIGSPRPR